MLSVMRARTPPSPLPPGHACHLLLRAFSRWVLSQVEKMADTPINPNIHLDNDLLGKSYKAAVAFFRDDFPDNAKLYIIAGDQDQIVDPLQARPQPCWKDIITSM